MKKLTKKRIKQLLEYLLEEVNGLRLSEVKEMEMCSKMNDLQLRNFKNDLIQLLEELNEQ